MPSPWLSENFPRKAPYFPQIGDILMVFKKGYEKYMEFVELRNTYKVNKRDLLWMKRKSLEDGTLVRNIKFFLDNYESVKIRFLTVSNWLKFIFCHFCFINKKIFFDNIIFQFFYKGQSLQNSI